jgi:hypothetical protein
MLELYCNAVVDLLSKGNPSGAAIWAKNPSIFIIYH